MTEMLTDNALHPPHLPQGQRRPRRRLQPQRRRRRRQGIAATRPASAATSPARRTRTQIDTWLQVNADNTVHDLPSARSSWARAPRRVCCRSRRRSSTSTSRRSRDAGRHEHHAGPGLHGRFDLDPRGGPAAARRPRRRHGRRSLDLASAKLGVPASQLSVSKGVVSGGGKSVTYGELVGGKLFNMKTTGTAPQKKVADYKVVGKRMPRARHPGQGERQVHLHPQRARAGDAPRPRRPPARPGGVRQGAKPLSVDESSIRNIPGAQVVRVGDFLGVVAPHEYGAIQAAAQLKVKWARDPMLPGNGDIFGEDALGDDDRPRPGQHGQRRRRRSTRPAQEGRRDSYTYAYQSHGALGPMCAVADVKADSARCSRSRRAPYGLRSKLAPALEDGREQDPRPVLRRLGRLRPIDLRRRRQSAALMSQKVGKPVRLQFMRWDEHGWDTHGPAQLTDLRGSRRREGEDLALRVHVVADPLLLGRLGAASSPARRSRPRVPAPPTPRAPDRSTTLPNRRVDRQVAAALQRLPQGDVPACAARPAGDVRVGAVRRRAGLCGGDGPGRVPPAEHHRRAVDGRAERGRPRLRSGSRASRRAQAGAATSSPVAASRSAASPTRSSAPSPRSR